MAKLIMLLLAAMLFYCTTYTQETGTTQIVGKTWKLQKEEMSGIGTHTELPVGATLKIYSNKTWICTEAIDGYKNGSWEIDKNGYLKLSMGNEKATAYTENRGELRIVLKTLFTVRTLYWKQS